MISIKLDQFTRKTSLDRELESLGFRRPQTLIPILHQRLFKAVDHFPSHGRLSSNACVSTSLSVSKTPYRTVRRPWLGGGTRNSGWATIRSLGCVGTTIVNWPYHAGCSTWRALARPSKPAS